MRRRKRKGGRARSWVWRGVSGVVSLVGGEGGGVPWRVGEVEDVRCGIRVEREGRWRRVVLNMVDG